MANRCRGSLQAVHASYAPKSRGDYAFILHMLAVCRPIAGRMAVVAPHGVLFRSGTEGKIREKLVRDNLLDAVVGLPGQLFPMFAFSSWIAREKGGLRAHERQRRPTIRERPRADHSGVGGAIISDRGAASFRYRGAASLGISTVCLISAQCQSPGAARFDPFAKTSRNPAVCA